MARSPNSEIFSPDTIDIVHVCNRVVRRAFLLGDDSVSQKNYDHRKEWIEQLIERFARFFGLDVLTYAILSNHFHAVLRSRPDVVKDWRDEEVATRWLSICPPRKDRRVGRNRSVTQIFNRLRVNQKSYRSCGGGSVASPGGCGFCASESLSAPTKKTMQRASFGSHASRRRVCVMMPPLSLVRPMLT